MSPQRSNRDALVEGALRCLERLPPERITARAIAEESGANLASIGYHFGTKDALVTEAVTVGLDRWLAEVERGLAEVEGADPGERFALAGAVIDRTRERHRGLAEGFLASLAKARHDEAVRAVLVAGFERTRPAVARLLGFGEDAEGVDAAGLVVAMFNGLLFQALLDPSLAIEGDRLRAALAQLGDVLP